MWCSETIWKILTIFYWNISLVEFRQEMPVAVFRQKFIFDIRHWFKHQELAVQLGGLRRLTSISLCYIHPDCHNPLQLANMSLVSHHFPILEANTYILFKQHYMKHFMKFILSIVNVFLRYQLWDGRGEGMEGDKKVSGCHWTLVSGGIDLASWTLWPHWSRRSGHCAVIGQTPGVLHNYGHIHTSTTHPGYNIILLHYNFSNCSQKERKIKF